MDRMPQSVQMARVTSTDPVRSSRPVGETKMPEPKERGKRSTLRRLTLTCGGRRIPTNHGSYDEGDPTQQVHPLPQVVVLLLALAVHGVGLTTS